MSTAQVVKARACQRFARTALRATSLRPTTPPSRAPLTWVVVPGRGVMHGVVNHPRIDGKDAVRPSALRPATAGHTAAVSWSAAGSPDTADPRVLAIASY